MGMTARLLDPRIGQYLLREEGEVVVDEVRHHWAAYTRAALEFVFGGVVLATVPFVRVEIGWLPLVAWLLLWLHAGWLAVREHMDRFVITNMRVFRIHGVFNQHLATMPMTRILDISLTQSLEGQLLGYGHFVFESAAQDQGLKEIRFVGRPEERDLTIQRVIQRAGLRKTMQLDHMHH